MPYLVSCACALDTCVNACQVRYDAGGCLECVVMCRGEDMLLRGHAAGRGHADGDCTKQNGVACVCVRTHGACAKHAHAHVCEVERMCACTNGANACVQDNPGIGRAPEPAGTRSNIVEKHARTVRASVPSGLHALVAVMVGPCEADETKET